MNRNRHVILKRSILARQLFWGKTLFILFDSINHFLLKFYLKQWRALNPTDKKLWTGIDRSFQTGLFLHAAVSRNGLILIFDSSILGMSTSIHTVHSFHPPLNFVWHFKYHKKNNDVSSQKSNKFNSQLPGQICLAK